MKNQICRKSNTRGISMVEMMITVAVVGILSSMVLPAVSDLRTSTSEAKLSNDVATLNEAVKVYLASGGKVAGESDASVILSKLRSKGKIEDAYRTVGVTGSFLDPRIFLVSASGGEAGTRWNEAGQRFEIARGGERFRLAIAETPFEVAEETRDGAVFDFAKEGWIWEYGDALAGPLMGPDFVATTQPVTLAPVYSGPDLTVSPVVTVTDAVTPNIAINPGFETENGRDDRTTTWSSQGLIAYATDQNNVFGWNTTAHDGMIEVWESGFSNVPSYSGDYHIEFNANEVSTLWQEVDTSNAAFVRIFFAHGQRNNTSEQLRLLVGTSPPLSKTNSSQVENLDAQGFDEVMVTNTSSVGGWETYSDYYPVPEGVDTLYFAFQSIGQFATLSIGNFLDEVSFQKINPLTVTGFNINISAGSSISNVIEQAEITLVAPQAGDDIDFPSLPSGFVLQRDESGSNIKLTLTGTGSRTQYSDLLKTLTFTTTSENTNTREFIFSINDGYESSGAIEYYLDL